MHITYEQAIAFVFEYEGGYTNDPADPGGPTNWGITISDARQYWLPNATAQDIEKMPKSVAEDIYRSHYATPINYDELPPGIDFSVLDYAVNSGVSRSIKTLQSIVGVPQDGVMGPATIKAVGLANPSTVINQIWNQRLAFDQSLSTWNVFGHGWVNRINAGKILALSMAKTPVSQPVATGNLLTTLSNFLNKLFSKGK